HKRGEFAELAEEIALQREIIIAGAEIPAAIARGEFHFARGGKERFLWQIKGIAKAAQYIAKPAGVRDGLPRCRSAICRYAGISSANNNAGAGDVHPGYGALQRPMPILKRGDERHIYNVRAFLGTVLAAAGVDARAEPQVEITEAEAVLRNGCCGARA